MTLEVVEPSVLSIQNFSFDGDVYELLCGTAEEGIKEISKRHLNKGSIYVHINDGHIYVGETHQSVAIRVRIHKASSKWYKDPLNDPKKARIFSLSMKNGSMNTDERRAVEYFTTNGFSKYGFKTVNRTIKSDNPALHEFSNMHALALVLVQFIADYEKSSNQDLSFSRTFEDVNSRQLTYRNKSKKFFVDAKIPDNGGIDLHRAGGISGKISPSALKSPVISQNNRIVAKESKEKFGKITWEGELHFDARSTALSAALGRYSADDWVPMIT